VNKYTRASIVVFDLGVLVSVVIEVPVAIKAWSG
jgi:hypothetical protein